MVAALILGRGGSTGLPRKNLLPVHGRPLMAYPILAAKNAPSVDRLYLSTDDAEIAGVGRSMGCDIIDRPDYLASNTALAEDAYVHGFEEIVRRQGAEPELLVLLFCNGATVLAAHIEAGITALRADAALDSACTASCYNMWSPLRAKKIDAAGRLVPFIEPEFFGDAATCDRGSQGDTWFADCSVFIVRPRCMQLRNGVPPFRWLGHAIHPILQEGGLDVDSGWQVPMVEHWLSRNGFTAASTPYDQRAGGQR